MGRGRWEVNLSLNKFFKLYLGGLRRLSKCQFKGFCSKVKLVFLFHSISTRLLMHINLVNMITCLNVWRYLWWRSFLFLLLLKWNSKFRYTFLFKIFGVKYADVYSCTHFNIVACACLCFLISFVPCFQRNLADFNI